jgi:hypothetical protein
MADKIKITKEDIPNLELPDGYKLQKNPTIQDHIDEQERNLAMLAEMTETVPTDAELLEWVKSSMQHPYYAALEQKRFTEEHITRLRGELDNGS